MVGWIRRRFGGGWRDALDVWPDPGDEPASPGTTDGPVPVPIAPEVSVWRREQRSLGAELVADCEAFVLGHYADRLEARSIAVPVWAWTNLLAHATEQELRAEMFATGAAGPGGHEWHAARAYLAAEVLDAVNREGALWAVQGSALMPLELALAARTDVSAWSCRQWVDAVRAALAHPRSPHA